MKWNNTVGVNIIINLWNKGASIQEIVSKTGYAYETVKMIVEAKKVASFLQGK